ncbi:MAG TPA: response regulator [Edaphobacter sp.]|nr:response regulator [Edaphobacter sp.]
MHTKTILLVDDNAVQATVRQAILKRNGYAVITALNPARVLEQLRNGDFLSEIDLVITDHIMPGMSGSAFVQEVRRLRSHVPVLVISGLEEAAQEYEELRVVFRLKPLPPEDLLRCVQEMAGMPETIDPLEPVISPATA